LHAENNDKESGTMSTANANLLIISDLHLGEDIRPGALGSLRHVVRLERELVAFLSHYTNERLGDRPWRLVVNGDMVDFLGVCLLPTDAEFGGEALNAEEQIWGLGTHPRAARAKMRRVLERHAGVFRSLAAFVAAGNDLDIVVGNHDVEFHWPIVQETFKRGVAQLTPAGAVRSVEEVASAIRFHPWFYFEENVAWVEHGHQYDGYCSFDYVLQPAVEPEQAGANEAGTEDSQEILLNVSSAGLRYVTNHTGGYKEGQEAWTFFAYLGWGVSLGWNGLMRLATGFYLMSARLIGLWRRFRGPEARARRRAAHRARLKELADQFRLGEDILLAVDELRRAPIVQNLGKLLAALMLDKLALYGFAAVLVMVFALALPWSWALGAVLGTIGVATIASRYLERGRECLDPTARMQQVTLEIRRRVQARYVVFGHTHAPLAVPLADGGMYFNTGTWVQHGEVAANAHAFTHVMIRHEDTGPVAALCEWKDGASREIR
jgi:UDP-2,3-diacylglucosamine pyrophosphatase LpxH